MVNIQVDDITANALELAANRAGLTVPEFVKLLASSMTPKPNAESWESLEKEFLELSVDGSLPSNFSRADIYAEHD